jgi:hypothetical protein
MNKYRRQHTSYNLSPAVLWILFTVAVAWGIFRIIRFRNNVNALHKIESEENKYNKEGPALVKPALII